jgi:hypothetical protein
LLNFYKEKSFYLFEIRRIKKPPLLLLLIVAVYPVSQTNDTTGAQIPVSAIKPFYIASGFRLFPLKI